MFRLTRFIIILLLSFNTQADNFYGSTNPEMIRIPGGNYEMGKYEVTQLQWHTVMGSNPSDPRSSCANCPVNYVNWYDVQEFLQKLNAQTGKQYRLPTEAEWKYACYGGTKIEYCGSNDINAVAWHDGNSGNQPHPVGQKRANAYGLYDMSGNVSEWTQDKYTQDPANNQGDWRVLRGGGYTSSEIFHRAELPDHRLKASEASERFYTKGFRLARTLP